MMKKLGIVLMAGFFSISVAGLSFADEKAATPAPAAKEEMKKEETKKPAPKKAKKKAAKKAEEAPAPAPEKK
ncbi:MAG: histone [candidate division NC10 bacterium]|nr:histone [candidate division NC10 bacterium]MDE2484781.1 histone [candidate division NC10 bacterium]